MLYIKYKKIDHIINNIIGTKFNIYIKSIKKNCNLTIRFSKGQNLVTKLVVV